MSKVKLKVLRFDPKIDRAPRYQIYEVAWREGLILLQALKEVRDCQDHTLAFRDYCCGCAWCMSCLMMINGRVGQACLKVLEPEEFVIVEPCEGFPVIRDLVVDFGIDVYTSEGVFNLKSGTLVKKKHKNV
ncbi:MAG: 2Fe-2S iron-sulfur cluster-binding protein [candidate division WOR-3 bacterium]